MMYDVAPGAGSQSSIGVERTPEHTPPDALSDAVQGVAPLPSRESRSPVTSPGTVLVTVGGVQVNEPTSEKRPLTVVYGLMLLSMARTRQYQVPALVGMHWLSKRPCLLH